MQMKTSMLSDGCVIPLFIDHSDFKHKGCYELEKLIVRELTKLISDKVFNSKQLMNIDVNISTLFNRMFDIDRDISLLYWQFTIELIDYYIVESVSGEFYESGANLKNYRDSHLLV